MRTHCPGPIALSLLALAALPAGCGSPEPAPAQQVITYGSTGTRAQIDCADGGSLDVSGSNNTLTVAGRCASVRVEGADNPITVARLDDRLTVAGLNNTVTYREGDPAIDDSGDGNRISRAE